MIARHRHAKPDEWEDGIRQPVHPAEIAHPVTAVETQVQPHIHKLVDAEAGQKIDLEAIGLKVSPADVEIAFEGCDAPAQRTISEDDVGLCMGYAYVLHRNLTRYEDAEV